MTESVRTFFYGGLMNSAVMARVGFSQRAQTLGSLLGFRIHIEPWVNLLPDPLSACFGVLMTVSHEELASIYAKLAVEYLPYPVVVHTGLGLVPALTYIAGDMDKRVADPGHITPLLESAQELGFPAWYVEQIRSFLPAD